MKELTEINLKIKQFEQQQSQIEGEIMIVTNQIRKLYEQRKSILNYLNTDSHNENPF